MNERPGTRYGLAALDNELRQLELSPQSGRHNQLYRSSAAVGNLVGGSELDETHAKASLVGRAIAIGHDRADAERTVTAGLRRGMTTPRVASATGTMLRTRSDAVLDVVSWWECVHEDRWRGAQAATSLKILAGIARIALHAGKVRLGISVRQLSEAAGVSTSTIHNHRHRWEGHVRRVEPGSPRTGDAAVYQLTAGAQERDKSETPLPAIADCSDPVRGRISLVDPAHNYWHKAATRWWLYNILLGSDSTVTARDVASMSGISASAIRRDLLRFEADGVVNRYDDGGWELSGSRDPDRLDAESLDYRDQRRTRHGLERDLHRRVMVESSRQAARGDVSFLHRRTAATA